MPFIPHTDADVKAMLAKIGIKNIEELFSEIPAELKAKDEKFVTVPLSKSQAEVSRLVSERAALDQEAGLCFIGAGAYEHFIPSPIWEIAARGEFMTAYTPYQAEASQGTLQTIYEYQTMMANLMALDVSNASLYDGASGLAEAALMAVRANKNSSSRTILVPKTINPVYRKTLSTITEGQNIKLIELPLKVESGRISLDMLNEFTSKDIAAIIIPQPNFFGNLEEVDELTDWAHAQKALVIGLVNPLAMALLKPPGKWGKDGADIAVGDGGPLGAPLSSGGPYFGFMCCKAEYMRQMPGRVIGRTTDTNGKEGFVLTLQAREQHIRRSKATSNICSNQGLMVTAATMYMSLLGAKGMQEIASTCHENAKMLREKLGKISEAEVVFASQPFFHEFVLRFKKPVSQILENLADKSKIQGGYDLTRDYPELNNCLLICATETKNNEDLDLYAKTLTEVLR